VPELDTAEIERALREHRAELEEQLANLTRAPERGSGISFGKRVGDGTTEAVSRLNEVGVADNLTASMEGIDRALAKLADGSYGTCDVCGEPIPAARLEARPESVACVKHAGGARRAP
jgi:RNA polymerase-binding transcription factor